MEISHCTFGGYAIDAPSLDMYADASNSFVIPERDVEFVSVPGRNGDISFDNGRFKNVIIPVDVYIRRNFLERHSTLMNGLYSFKGYQHLRLPNRTDMFRLAVLHSSVTWETGPWLDSGWVTLSFNCKPFWYYNTGDNPVDLDFVTPTAEFENPSAFASRPLITFEMDSSVTTSASLTIVSQMGHGTQNLITLERSANTGTATVTVDCENLTAEVGESGTTVKIRKYPSTGGSYEDGYFEFPGWDKFTLTIPNGCTARIYPRWVTL